MISLHNAAKRDNKRVRHRTLVLPFYVQGYVQSELSKGPRRQVRIYQKKRIPHSFSSEPISLLVVSQPFAVSSKTL